MTAAKLTRVADDLLALSADLSPIPHEAIHAAALRIKAQLEWIEQGLAE